MSESVRVLSPVSALPRISDAACRAAGLGRHDLRHLVLAAVAAGLALPGDLEVPRGRVRVSRDPDGALRVALDEDQHRARVLAKRVRAAAELLRAEGWEVREPGERQGPAQEGTP